MGDKTTANRKQRHTSSESNKSGVSNDSVGQYIPTPPDGGWGWVIVISSLFCNIIVDGINYSFGVFMLEFAEYFNETKSKTSLVGSLLCGMYLLTGPIVSGLVNKFGCRPVTVAGSIVATIAFLLSTQSTSIEVLILTYGVLGGIGFGMIYLPSIVSVGYYFEKRRALATGIAVCGSGIGTFIFAPLSQYLLEELDWKNAMFIIAGIVLHGAICGMLMRPLEAPKRRKKRPRTKNMLDRLKEQRNAKNGRARSESESNMQALGVRDTNLVLEGVMEAKLLREKELQEDDSEVGSIPSQYFLKGLSTSDTRDGRIHKLSLSDKGDEPGSLTSPDAAPKIVVEETNPERASASPTSERPLSTGTEASLTAQDTGENNTSDNNNMDNVDDTDVNLKKRGSEKSTSTTRSSTRDSQATVTSDHGAANGSILPTSRERSMTDSFHSRSLSVKSDTKYVVNGRSGPHEVVPLLAHSEARIDHIHKKAKQKSPVWHPGSHLRIPDHVPSTSKIDYARPLYKQDIFYSGSVMNIPQFQSQPDMRSYITSITTIPGTLAYEKMTSSFWDKCSCLPKSVRDTLAEMLDISLLTNKAFMFIFLGNIFAMAGILVPFIFLVDRTQLLGIDKDKSAFLISVIGITNTVGRLLAGFLADLPRVDSLIVNNVSLIIAGVAVALAPFCLSYPLLIVFAAVFGLCMAAYISLTSIILCDLLGLEKLTNAFGLLTLARGVSAIAGPPLIGAIYDMTGSYDGAFYVGGGIIMIGALLHCCIHLPFIKRHQNRNNADNEVFADVEVIGVASATKTDDAVASV